MGVFHTNVFLVRALSENSWLRQSLEGRICFCFFGQPCKMEVIISGDEKH